MSTTGEIKKYLDHRGFGFLKSTNPNEGEVFFHVSQIDGNWVPQAGMFCSYEVDMNDRGKAEARNVKLLPKEEADKERAWATTEPVRVDDVSY